MPNGTEGPDILEGTSGNDVINGLGGDDTILLSQGNDTIDGGAGTFDRLIAFTATSSVFTLATGPRTYVVGSNAVTDSSGTLNTTFSGIERVRISTISNGNFNDTLDGSAFTGASGVEFNTGSGNDTLIGSAAGDYFSPGWGANTVDGGAGYDTMTVSYRGNSGGPLVVTQSGTTLTFTEPGDGADVVSNVEGFTIFSAGSEPLHVDASATSIGLAMYTVASAADILIGGAGNDRFWTGFNNSAATGDSFTGNGGADAFEFARLTSGFDGATITDLSLIDRIDLSQAQYNDGFTPTFISSSTFTGVAGQYRYVKSGGQTFLQADTNGDAIADRTLTIANGEFDLVQTSFNVLQIAASINGTASGNTLFGTAGNDTINAFGGDDTIYGSNGVDTIDGGAHGTVGDQLYFNFARPELSAPANNISYNLTNSSFTDDVGTVDTAFVGIERFRISLLTNFDVTFDASAWTIVPPLLDNLYIFGNGNNTVTGSITNERIYLGTGSNVVDGGAGDDLVGVEINNNGLIAFVSGNSASSTVEQGGQFILTAVDVETVYVGNVYATFDQHIDASASTLVTYLADGSGSDTLLGGAGVDTFFTGPTSGGVDILTGNGGADVFDFIGTAGALDGTIITDFASDDVIDLRYNDFGDHQITSFIGQSEFSGVVGQYRYYVSAGSTYVEIDFDGDTHGDSTLKISNGQFSLTASGNGEGGGNHLLRISGTISGTYGTPANDTLTGDETANQIFGLAGNDELIGLGASDFLVGGAGNDIVRGGDGSDALQGGFYFEAGAFGYTAESEFAGDDQFFGGAGVDSVFFGTGTTGLTVDLRLAGPQNTGYGMDSFDSVEIVSGTAHSDTLSGNDSSNWLQGWWLYPNTSGMNNDTLSGYGGDDILSGGKGDHVVDGGTGSDWYHLDEPNFPRYPDYTVIPTSVSLLLQGQTQVTGFGTVVLTSVENLSGSDGPDTLTGDDGDNILAGNSGQDMLHGNGGNDTLYGDSRVTLLQSGPGVTQFVTGSTNNDGLYGGAGNDTLFGELGNDILDGGTGADILRGGVGDDIYYADNAGDQVIEAAGEGTDEARTALASYTLGANLENLTGTAAGGQTLIGNAVANTIVGGAGNDVINGQNGDDTMRGGAGNDYYYVSNAGDTVTENAAEGADTVIAYVSHTLADNVENLRLLAAGQTGTGNALANTIYGSSGSDTIAGLGGADRIDAGAGNDTIDGGEGADVIFGGADNDTIDGGAGADYMAGQLGDDTYYVDDAGDTALEQPGQGTDTVITGLATYQLRPDVEILIGTSASGQTLLGSTTANTIEGGGGNDAINGLLGADTMKGGAGDDFYYVDNAGDLVVENPGEGIDTVIAYVNHTLGDSVENLRLLIGSLTGTGNGLDNTMFGSAATDTLLGLGGSDRINGGTGHDTIDAGEGDDFVWGGTGNDTIEGGLGNDVLRGEGDNDTITGGAGADVLVGGDGHDVLRGGLDKDTLYGEAGADRFVFGPGESAAARAGADIIVAFSNADGDRIDLRPIDANTTGGAPGDQGFTFIGNAAFSSVAGQLRFENAGGATWIEGDTNGDAIVDFTIQLTGTLTPMAGDFLL